MMGPHEMGVRIAPVKSTKVEVSSEYEAVLKSRKSISLSPQIDGHVTKIFVTSGDEVKQGQPIMEVDPLRQKELVNSYEEAAHSSKADLTTAINTLKSYEATRVSRISNLKFAKQQQERYVRLEEDGAVAKQELDRANNAYEVAQGDLSNIESQIKAQEATIDKLQRMVKQAEATTRSQKVQLGYYAICAPIAGTVGDIPVKLGDYVTPSVKLTTITQNKPLEAYVSVPTERGGEIKIGTSIELTSRTTDQELCTGKVFFVSPNVDESSQSILVKASIANGDGKLRADQLVHARVIWKQVPGLLIPTEAVARSAGQEFVFVAQATADQKMVAKQTPVKLGDIQGTQYQVLGGLKPGDNVVVSGVQNLSDGAPIVKTQ